MVSRQPFAVPDGTAVAGDPGQGALYDPPAGQDFEGVQVIGSLDDLEGELERGLGPGDQLPAVAAVGPGQLDLGKRLPQAQQRPGCVAVLRRAQHGTTARRAPGIAPDSAPKRLPGAVTAEAPRTADQKITKRYGLRPLPSFKQALRRRLSAAVVLTVPSTPAGYSRFGQEDIYREYLSCRKIFVHYWPHNAPWSVNPPRGWGGCDGMDQRYLRASVRVPGRNRRVAGAIAFESVLLPLQSTLGIANCLCPPR
jgi:hypothetical protein